MTAAPVAPYWIVGRAKLLEAELPVGEDAGDADPPTADRRLPAAAEVVDGLGRVTVAGDAGTVGSEVDERAALTGVPLASRVESSTGVRPLARTILMISGKAPALDVRFACIKMLSPACARDARATS